MKNETSGLYKCSSCGDELGSVTLVYCEECSKKLLYEMNGRQDQDYDSGVKRSTEEVRRCMVD